MSKYCYVHKRFRAAALKTIEDANGIIEEYERDGYDLTLRQLYYQFVSRDLIPNNMREYKNLQAVINDARLAGLISWTAIEDRTRNLKDFAYYALRSPESVLESAAEYHDINYWADQPYYCEVWVEKEALLGVIEKPCSDMKVPYFACKGNNSQSEMYAAGQRFIEKIDDGKQVMVFHLGDHDPSGIDMTRDNDDRLKMFIGAESDVSMFELQRLALNIRHIKKYKPPSNPMKKTDTRWKNYVKVTGERESWELDALKPQVIANIISDAINQIVDQEAWDASRDKEEAEKDTFREAVKRLKGE